jgi:hypothetical protein
MLFLADAKDFWQNIPRMIHKRLHGLGLVVILTGGLFAGCGKSDPPSSNSGSPATPSATLTPQSSTNSAPVLRFHWLGKKQLAGSTNAAHFLDLWNLPESVSLEAQTLDKLAAAPWRFWQTNLALSNAPTALLRPLLDDLVHEESYLEVRAEPNQPPELVLAVRVSDDRAALWQTNLPLALQSIFGNSPEPRTQSPGLDSAFNFQLSTFNFQLSLTRSGAWTLLAITGTRPSTLDPRPSELLSVFQQRLTTNTTPYVARATNYWMEAFVDAARLKLAFSSSGNPTANLPQLALWIIGDGQNMRTSGELKFPVSLNLDLEPWRIPTNIIHDPLVSFTAMRGVARWIGGREEWRNKDLGPAPNQVFFWAQSPALWQHFLTYPVANASNHVTALGAWVLQEWNPIFQTNRVGSFAWSTNKFGLIWMGVPFFKPVLEPARFASSDFALVGLFANNATNRPVPAGLFTEFQNRSNLVYYDWEITPPQVTSWTQMGQLLRMVFGRRQLSPATASLPWLKAMSPNLGNASTVMTLEAPDRLAFKRTSTFGLTSVELHLLADWLESPEFPRGTHTQLQRRPPIPASAITNVLPAAVPGK